MNKKYLILPALLLLLLFSKNKIYANDDINHHQSFNEDPITCVSFLSAELMPFDSDNDGVPDGGLAEVFAHEFVQNFHDSFSDDCLPIQSNAECILMDDITDLENYDFETPPASAKISLSFDCDVVPLRKLAIWAKKDDGTWSFCTAYVELQNNMGGCEPFRFDDLVVNVEGPGCIRSFDVIINDESNTLHNFPIIGECSGGFNVSGGFKLEPTINEEFTISLLSDEDHTNGVSTRDIVIAVQHILGIKDFETISQLLAADVDRSGSISISDLVISRQMILGKREKFPNNTSWRFYLREEEYKDTDVPIGVPIKETVNVTYEGETIKLDFVAVKVGDLDGSNKISVRNANSTLSFQLADVHLEANESYQIDFRAKDFQDILGFQFALQMDAEQLEIKKVIAGDLSHMDENNFGLQQVAEGIVKASWNTFEKIDMNSEDILFSVSVKAKKAMQLSKAISLLPIQLTPEAYDVDLRQMPITLSFNKTLTNADEVQLFQSQPNPFVNETTLSYYLPKGEEVKWSIYDVNGKLIKQQIGRMEKGLHQKLLIASDLPSAGLYYFQLTVNEQHFNKKIIRL